MPRQILAQRASNRLIVERMDDARDRACTGRLNAARLDRLLRNDARHVIEVEPHGLPWHVGDELK
jgi:hypothetical protein